MTQPLQAVPQHTMKVEPRTERVCRELWRIHLRHPGMVKPSIVQLLKKDSLFHYEICSIHIEAHRLGVKVVPA